MYDPQSVAHEIYFPWVRSVTTFKDGTKSRHWARFITIWHVDPERPGTCNRRDDSCGWFDRGPGEYADAVKYALGEKDFVHEIKLTLARKVETPAPFYEGISEQQLSWPKLSLADTLALTMLISRHLEMRRWWNGQNGKDGASRSFWAKVLRRRRSVSDVAEALALTPFDSLSAPETPESAVRLVAAALNRHFRPWWRHPRWHIHHWKFQIHPWQQFKRWAFHRCAHCKKGFKWGYSAVSHGGDAIYHEECSSIVWARDRKQAAPDPDGVVDAMTAPSVH